MGEDNIKIDLKEIGWTGFQWVRAGSVASSCEHGNELWSSI